MTAHALIERKPSPPGMVAIQRARMVAATLEVARERRVGEITVAHIAACSKVSRRTFYDLFEDREACFLAAFDEGVRRATTRVCPAFETAGSWQKRIRASLGALLEFLDDEPEFGALCVVDALSMGQAVHRRRALVVERLIEAIDEGRREASAGVTPTRLVAEGVVGAVLAILHGQLSAGRRDTSRAPRSGRSDADCARTYGTGREGPRKSGSQSMTRLLSPLMGIIVLPYRGAAAAQWEISRPAPGRRRAAGALGGDPLRELDIRLTYRTVRVLRAIAELEGRGAAPSNRQVADAAGVADQGQISRLLARLGHLGLIRKDGVGPYRGEPNAWRLTSLGQRLIEQLRLEDHGRRGFQANKREACANVRQAKP
jgi:AcrR family transcriptional regulator